MKDIELLEQHRSGHPQAFAELVNKHLGWVYGLARRQLRDAHLAEDVAQAVFVLLHRKAPSFPADGALIRWLHKTAQYASQVAIRTERRRTQRETEAAMLKPQITETTDTSLELSPMLDDLVSRLSRSDREAILLRYYRDLSFAEVGNETGATPEAARKRVERAIEKLRIFAQKKGLSLTDVALAADLVASVRVAIPPALITSATSVGTNSAIIASSTTSIVKGTILMMTIKSSAIAAIAIASIFVVVGTIWAVRPIESSAPPGARVAQSVSTGRGALAPAIRWRAQSPSISNSEIPEIQIDGTWYELQKLRDKPIAEIVAYAKKSFGIDWQRRFQEDLEPMLKDMNLADGPMKVELRRLDTSEIITLPDVPMTVANRQLVMVGSQDEFSTGTRRLFSAVRWHDNTADVQVNGNETWYALTSVSDQPAGLFLDFAQKTYGDSWKKEIEDNAVGVLDAMTHRLDPMADVWLRLETLDTKSPVAILKCVFPPVSLKPPIAEIMPQKRFPRLSPFSAVRWHDADYQVQLNDNWYALVSINDQPLSQIIEFTKKQYGNDMVQKRIDEDLVEVLTTMGQKPNSTVTLQLRALDTGESITRDNVPMTVENRRQILQARQTNAQPPATAPAGTSGL
jgi:RNA polymerase sigma factor (sigma-70 family)